MERVSKSDTTQITPKSLLPPTLIPLHIEVETKGPSLLIDDSSIMWWLTPCDTADPRHHRCKPEHSLFAASGKSEWANPTQATLAQFTVIEYAKRQYKCDWLEQIVGLSPTDLWNKFLQEQSRVKMDRARLLLKDVEKGLEWWSKRCVSEAAVFLLHSPMLRHQIDVPTSPSAVACKIGHVPIDQHLHKAITNYRLRLNSMDKRQMVHSEFIFIGGATSNRIAQSLRCLCRYIYDPTFPYLMELDSTSYYFASASTFIIILPKEVLETAKAVLRAELDQYEMSRVWLAEDGQSDDALIRRLSLLLKRDLMKESRAREQKKYTKK